MSRADFDRFATEDARLVILRELAAQADHRLSETMLAHTLQAFGHNRPREWVKSQLRWLATMSAVTVTEVGSVLIAELRRAGDDHVRRRAFLDGVARPSVPD